MAACLGSLALVAPEAVLPTMAQQVSSPSADMRAVVVSALKTTVQEGTHAADQQLQVRGAGATPPHDAPHPTAVPICSA